MPLIWQPKVLALPSKQLKPTITKLRGVRESFYDQKDQAELVLNLSLIRMQLNVRKPKKKRWTKGGRIQDLPQTQTTICLP